MRIAFITRSTLFEIHGGSAVQAIETAKQLEKLGVSVSIFPAHKKINYQEFDLLHFYDLTRPANILYHIKKAGLPFVITPILVDYSEYDRKYRSGMAGFLFRTLGSKHTEYLKTVARWLLRKDSLRSKDYLWKGQHRSIKEILQKTSILLPNSISEYKKLQSLYGIQKPYVVIPNGVDLAVFQNSNPGVKDDTLVICAARFEGLKNQLNLIKALNNTKFTLVLIGEASPNQKKYRDKCKKAAASNIQFIDRLPQKELATFYQKAKVHVLPSWFETCGLSSLEAAAMGCNIVITDKGFTRDHFGENAFYCNPEDPASIYEAVGKAAQASCYKEWQTKFLNEYTWEQAGLKTLEAYKTIR